MRTGSLLPIVLLLAAAPACSRRQAQPEAAVRQAVERYLASRPNLNMQGMDMQMGAIKLRDERAEADVTFRAKNDAKAILSMHYRLKRRQGQWEVEPQAGGHGGVVPSTGPGTTAELPADPPASSALPAGHPPVKTP